MTAPSQWVPQRDAPIAYQDQRIQIYADGTWTGILKGRWTLGRPGAPNAWVIHANHVGDSGPMRCEATGCEGECQDYVPREASV